MTIQVKFSANMYTGNVKDRIIPVTVAATGVASFPYTIGVKPNVARLGPIHPAEPNCDFANETKFITFEPKQSADLQRMVNITVMPDCKGETGQNPEVFKISLFLSSDLECSVIDEGSPSEAFIIILD